FDAGLVGRRLRRDRASGDFDLKRFDCHRHASERFDRERFDCHRHASERFDCKRFDCHRHASERFDRERFDCHRHASERFDRKRFDCHRRVSECLESVIVCFPLEVFRVGSGQDTGLLWLRRGDGAAGDGGGEAEATGDDQA
ncbi:hypothetical protein, partial [Thermogemmata fonticola]